MIIPNHYVNSAGNIVLEITHSSEEKKETNKEWYDRKQYKNWIEIDPNNKEILNAECECQDFIITKGRSDYCKHLTQTIKELEKVGTYGTSGCFRSFRE